MYESPLRCEDPLELPDRPETEETETIESELAEPDDEDELLLSLSPLSLSMLSVEDICESSLSI